MNNRKVLIDALKKLGAAKAPTNKKDIIVDPNGQWAHPGEVTRIPSNTITMSGVPYPVLGKPNVGEPQMMYPGQDYQFPDADYVDEFPMQQGKQLVKKSLGGLTRFTGSAGKMMSLPPIVSTVANTAPKIAATLPIMNQATKSLLTNPAIDSYLPIRFGTDTYLPAGNEFYHINPEDYNILNETTQELEIDPNWRQEGLKDAYFSLNSASNKARGYGADLFKGLNYDFKDFSPGWQVGQNALHQLAGPQWMPSKEDFYTDDEVIDLFQKEVDYRNAWNQFDEMYPEEPGMNIMRGLSGDTSRDELFANLYPGVYMPNFRSKFLSPEQSAILNEKGLYNPTFTNKGMLNKSSLRGLTKGEDTLPRTYQQLLKLSEEEDWLKTADPKMIANEFRGMLKLKTDDIENATPQQLELWRRQVISQMRTQALDRWNAETGNPLTGNDAYGQFFNRPGARNKEGGVVKYEEGGETPTEFVSAKEGIDTPIYKQVSVKKSKIAGKGLFTNEPIQMGEPIGVSHIRKVFNKDGEMYQAPFPSTVLGYYNHSEEPNVKEVDNGDHIVMVATRDIKPNEELTSNYDISGIKDLETTANFKKGGSAPKMPKKKSPRSYSRSLEATNRLLAEHPFFAEPKSRKNKIYDPNAKYFQDGGENNCEDGRCLETDQAQELLDKADALRYKNVDLMWNVADKTNPEGKPPGNAAAVWKQYGAGSLGSRLGMDNPANCMWAAGSGYQCLPETKGKIPLQPFESNDKFISAVNRGATPFKRVGITQDPNFATPDTNMLRAGDIINMKGPKTSHAMTFSHYREDGVPIFLDSNGDARDFSWNQGLIPGMVPGKNGIKAYVSRLDPEALYRNEINQLEEKARTNPTYYQDGGENGPWNPDYEQPSTFEFKPLSAEQIRQREFEQEQERLRQEEERFRLEQESWTPKQWDEYRIKEDARKYQQALTNEPNYFNEGIQFVTDWHNSPMYNQMVLNSYKGDQKSADYVTKLRKQNIASIPELNIINSRKTKYGDSAPMAWSFSDSGQIEVFPAGFESGPSTYVHEGLHSSDRPRGSFKGSGTNYPSWMLYNDPRFPNENVWFDRVIPLSDQKYITKNRSANYKDSEAYAIALKENPNNFKIPSDEEIKNEIITEGISIDDPKFQTTFNKYKKWYADDVKAYTKGWKENWKEYGHDYVSQPTEVRARLGEFRYYAKKAGIYDPFNEQLTPETYQKFINTYKDSENGDAIRSVNDLREQYTDEEIMWMLNNISKNDEPTKELDTAALGGEHMELDLTPEQIKEYVKGGYIIEDISVPELTKASYGMITKAAGKLAKVPKSSSAFVRGTTTILPKIPPTSIQLGKIPADFDIKNVTLPFSIADSKDKGYLTLHAYPGKRGMDGNTFHFLANMDSPLESGRAFNLMNESFTKPNPVILEPFSLSVDSLNTLLNMGRRPDWTLSYEDHLPLNYLTKHSNLFEGLQLPKGFRTMAPLSDETSTEMLTRLNNLLQEKGMTEQAKIVNVPGGPMKEIRVPNYKLTRNYSQGGSLPKAANGLILKPGQLLRSSIYKGINPASYAIAEKVMGIPNELLQTATNNATRPYRVGLSLKYGHQPFLETHLKTQKVPLADFKKMSDREQMQLFSPSTLSQLEDVGKRRLDAWAVGLGLPQEYGTLEQIGDNKFRMLNTEYSPMYFNELYNDLRALRYENTLTAGHNPLEDLTREAYKIKLQQTYENPQELAERMKHEDSMRILGYNPWQRERHAKLNPLPFSGIETGSVWDNDSYGVMGGFRWDINNNDQGLQFTTSDVWDLNPFEKRGHAYLNPSATAKQIAASSFFKPLQNVEALKLVGGKPFLIENNFVIDPKTYKTLDSWEDGGNIDYELGDEVDEATMRELEKLGYTFEKL